MKTGTNIATTEIQTTTRHNKVTFLDLQAPQAFPSEEMRGGRVNEESVRLYAVEYESHYAVLSFHEENTLDTSGIGGE